MLIKKKLILHIFNSLTKALPVWGCFLLGMSDRYKHYTKVGISVYLSLGGQYQKQIEKIMVEQPELNVNALKILTADLRYEVSKSNRCRVYIHFGKRRKLPNKPTLIMSATVFEDVYTYAYRYEKQTQFFSIDYVEKCGTLSQDLTYSFSKGNLYESLVEGSLNVFLYLAVIRTIQPTFSFPSESIQFNIR